VLVCLTIHAQTGIILIPDVVTTILQLMTGIGLLGVATLVIASLYSRWRVLIYQPALNAGHQRFD
jgi:hypothetical protein